MDNKTDMVAPLILSRIFVCADGNLVLTDFWEELEQDLKAMEIGQINENY